MKTRRMMVIAKMKTKMKYEDDEGEAGEEDDRQLFFHRRRMKSMQSSEKNVPTWPSKPPATAEESRKPVGTTCKYKATKN